MAFREVQEGILYRSGEAGVLVDRVLSRNNIQTLDLICEGEISGPVSGEYVYSGEIGEIGWRTAEFFPYSGVPNTDNNPTSGGWLRSVYWNEVPVLSVLGKSNFQRVDVSYSVGTPNGDLLGSNGELTVSRSIAERFRASELDDAGNPISNDVDNNKTYRIFNKDCTAVVINVKTPGLAKTITKGDNAGNVTDSTVEYWIYYRPMYNSIGQGPGENVNYILAARESIVGKVNYGYIRSSRINFDSSYTQRKSFLGWEIKLVRVTPDSYEGTLRNQTYIDSITEVYSSSFTYPNSSIVRSSFDAEFFQRVPARAFDMNLLKVLVPKNYDPILKTYAIEGDGTDNGGWDGTFKDEKVWTDNPAWCYYDLLTNKRYGLGKYLPQAKIDKLTLYEISQYCDQLVPNGYGGLEPRFTCNLILNTREDAYKVVNDMASIFRAITYYGGGSIYVTQDAAKDAIFQFTNANVENGDFSYSSSAKKTRHTVALVRYNDPTNFFKAGVEYVEDVDGIRRYGIRETEITAFGCTSRGQAIRLGRWALLSETQETETVSFVAGLDASYLRPGDIFKVFDRSKKTARNGGRTSHIYNHTSSAEVILDSVISLNTGNTYTLSVLTPGGFYNPGQTEGLTSLDTSGIRKPQIQKFNFTGIQATGLTGVSSGYSVVRLNEAFDRDNYSLDGNLVWTIEAADTNNETETFISANSDYFRTINVIEKEDSRYEVVGLQYSAAKFGQIESGLSFQRDDLYYRTRPEAPVALELKQRELTPYSKIVDYTFSVDNYTGISNYRVYAKKDFYESDLEPSGTYRIANLPTDTQQGTFIPSETGNYYFRIYSANEEVNLVSTGYVSGDILIEDVDPIRDIIISSLTTGSLTNNAGERDSVAFEGIDPVFNWQVGYSAATSAPSDLMYRITIRSGSNSNIPDPTIYYQVTGYRPANQETSWDGFDFETNDALANGPFSNYDIVVEGMNNQLKTSAGNQLNADGSILFDNQWVNGNNPFGYDILNVYNPTPTGIMMTKPDGTNIYDNGYYSTGGVTSNGNIEIVFTGRQFPQDVVGGYIWACVEPFDSGYAIRGTNFWPDGKNLNNKRIKILEFPVDSTQAEITCRFAYPFSSRQNIYTCIGFFDEFQKARKNKGKNISSGMWISNNVKTQLSAFTSVLEINQAEFDDTTSKKGASLYISTGSNDQFNVMLTNSSGVDLIVSSYKP